MAAFTILNENGAPRCVLITDGSTVAVRLLMEDGEGGIATRAMTPETARLMAYHMALLYKEMTGKTCLMPAGMTYEPGKPSDTPAPEGMVRVRRPAVVQPVAEPAPAPRARLRPAISS